MDQNGGSSMGTTGKAYCRRVVLRLSRSCSAESHGGGIPSDGASAEPSQTPTQHDPKAGNNCPTTSRNAATYESTYCKNVRRDVTQRSPACGRTSPQLENRLPTGTDGVGADGKTYKSTKPRTEPLPPDPNDGKARLAATTLLHGDCRDILKTIRTGSVDVVITDPIYPEVKRKDYPRDQ